MDKSQHVVRSIFQGFRFGMLLQVAVGPMCLMVFHTSATYGIAYGLVVMLSVALVDAIFIALASVGIAAFISKPSVKTAFKFLGGAVLVLFGVSMIAEAFEISLLPNIALFANVSSQNLFLQGFFLTASNPITILFWSGLFSTRMLEDDWDKKQLFFFAFGCVLSTLVFLSAVAYLGSVLSGFLPMIVIQVLNILVGVVLIFFGLRMLLKKIPEKEIRN